MIRTLRERARLFRRKVRKDLLLRGSSEKVFSRIYHRNRWRSKESRSGRGSELLYTENIRLELPKVLKTYGVSRLLDAPCGDFNWMRHVLPDVEVDYVGGDIVKALIWRNQKSFGAAKIAFQHMDIASDPLPTADLMMVRDCLFHLSYFDIYRFLENFCRAEIDLLLTTTHLPAQGENGDVRTGDYRKIYLFSPPFCFPCEPLYRMEDWVPPHSQREMCLFTREQVARARGAMKRNLGL